MEVDTNKTKFMVLNGHANDMINSQSIIVAVISVSVINSIIWMPFTTDGSLIGKPAEDKTR